MADAQAARQGNLGQPPPREWLYSNDGSPQMPRMESTEENKDGAVTRKKITR